MLIELIILFRSGQFIPHSILDISRSTRYSASFVTSSPNISKKSSSRNKTSGSSRFPTVAKRSILPTATIPSSKRNKSSSSDIPPPRPNNKAIRPVRTHYQGSEVRSSQPQVQTGSKSRSPNTRRSPHLQGARASIEKETTVLSVRTVAAVANQIPRDVVVEKDICTDKVEWRKEMLR